MGFVGGGGGGGGGGFGLEKRGGGASFFDQLTRPPMGVGHPAFFFLTGIGTHLTQSTTEVTPSSTKRRKHAFRAVVEKVKSLPKLRSLTD